MVGLQYQTWHWASHQTSNLVVRLHIRVVFLKSIFVFGVII
jgi:hypothetical protein